MHKEIATYSQDLSQRIAKHMVGEGAEMTLIPGLFFLRQFQCSEPRHIFHKPSLCIILQGKKELCMAEERFAYGTGDYLISSVELPVTGQVMEAKREKPYISLKLEFSPTQIVELIPAADKDVTREKRNRAMYVGQLEIPLMDAVSRLVQLVDTPDDIPVLAPVYTKEIFYRVLQGKHGDVLRQYALKGSTAYRMRGIIQEITHNYNRVLRIDELAQQANISVPTLHRQFKEITTMSPLQFQKQLRLQEARQLMLSTDIDVADAAFRVGYESPSQFSREYSRMFGCSPREDIKRLRARYVG
jgi:AraC-type DNA-binding domain-containing proteins